MGFQNWDALSREEKIVRLARGTGEVRRCPVCWREIEVVKGYWSQHSDPNGWSLKQPLPRCKNELRPA